MDTRYIFNTQGEYVGFVRQSYLFDPAGNWLGFLKSDNEVYSTTGDFMGYLLQDDRIAWRQDEPRKHRVQPPIAPMKQLLPLAPLKRLPMSPLLFPWRDALENRQGGQTRAPLFPRNAGFFQPPSQPASTSLERFLDAQIIAADGTNLGTVSRNSLDPDSIVNAFGRFGSKFNNQTILNPYGAYGSPYGQFSPYNEYSSTPPSLIKHGRQIGTLSANPYIPGAIHPDTLLKWLRGT